MVGLTDRQKNEMNLTLLATSPPLDYVKSFKYKLLHMSSADVRVSLRMHTILNIFLEQWLFVAFPIYHTGRDLLRALGRHNFGGLACAYLW